MTLSLELTILVIFGSIGDLTWLKLAPTLYNLLLDGQLAGHFAVTGLDLKNKNPDEFRLRMRDGANGFCECGGVDEKPGMGLLLTCPITPAILPARQPIRPYMVSLRTMKEMGWSCQSCYLSCHTAKHHGNHCPRHGRGPAR